MKHFTFRDSLQSIKFDFFAPALYALIERLKGCERCLETCQELFTSDMELIDLVRIRVHAESIFAAYTEAVTTFERGMAASMINSQFGLMPAFGEAMLSKCFDVLLISRHDTDGGSEHE